MHLPKRPLHGLPNPLESPSCLCFPHKAMQNWPSFRRQNKQTTELMQLVGSQFDKWLIDVHTNNWLIHQERLNSPFSTSHTPIPLRSTTEVLSHNLSCPLNRHKWFLSPCGWSFHPASSRATRPRPCTVPHACRPRIPEEIPEDRIGHTHRFGC